MHLKTCALLLLALAACQAAPSTKITDKKSAISEATTNIDKEDFKLEDPGTDKDRAKKSATTFCVEVRSGASHQVPCKNAQSAPSQPMAPAPQTVQTIQAQQPTFTNIKFEPTFQPAPQSHPSQSVDIVMPAAQPAPQSNIVVPQFPPAQPAQVYQFSASQPQPQSAKIIFPTPQTPETPTVNFIQTPPAQQTPVVNIVPAPAAPCNPPATYNIVQPQPAPQSVHTVHIVPQAPQPAPQVTVVQEGAKPTPVQVQEAMHGPPIPPPKPRPMPQKFQVRPVPESEMMPIGKPCFQQQPYVMPPNPMFFVSEPEMQPNTFIQMSPISPPCRHHQSSRPIVTECNCRPQNFQYRTKGSTSTDDRITAPTWPRTHSKIQEHHVMVYPASSTMPARSPLMVHCSPNVLSMNGNASPIVVGARNSSGQKHSTSNTVVSVQTGYNAHPVYSTTYPRPYPEIMPQVQPYNSYPAETYFQERPLVTVNAYPHMTRPVYRESQSPSSQDFPTNKGYPHKQQGETFCDVSEEIDFDKEPNNPKRETDITQLKDDQQNKFGNDQKEELKTDETDKTMEN